MRRLKKTLRKFYIAFGLLFAVLLFGLAVSTLLFPDREYSAEEKRGLAQFPEFNLSTLLDGSFMDGMEDWQADQFPFRSKLMQAKSKLTLALGAIRSQGVYRCPDGSLMEHFDMPDDSAIDNLVGSLTDFSERYPDIPKYFCIVPTAISVSEDKLPPAALTDDQNLYLDRLNDTLTSLGSVVDVRETFSQHKNDQQLYYFTDHHWTTDAAYLAWKEIYPAMNLSSSVNYTPGIVCNNFAGSLLSSSGFPIKKYDSISVYVPDVNPFYTVTYENEQRMTASVYAPEYLTDDDPYQIFFGGNFAKITIKAVNDNNRRLLIFKDSYANCLIPFFIPDFNEITIIDPRYYYDDLDMEILSSGYTEILFLYNANTLAADNSLAPVLRNEQ